MIKFFRTIRQNLLNEGKTTKYLKYAIGEIVLVMIGILLALQVNNWNDERKAKIEIEAQRQSNLKEIYSDLQKDVVTLDTIINQLERQKEASKYIAKILETKDKYIGDSLKFFIDMLVVAQSITVDRTKNTWDNLNSSGQLLSLKQDTLNKKLFDYYTYYDTRIKNFNELPREVRLKFRDYGTPCRIDIENAENLIVNYGSIHPDSSWFSCFMSLDGLHKILISLFRSSYYNITWFNQLKTQAQSIIAYMERNIIHS